MGFIPILPTAGEMQREYTADRGVHPIATWMILSRKAAKDAKATRNQRQEQSLRNLCALSGLARVIFATNAKPRRGLILNNPRLRERSDRSLGIECSERNPRPASERLNSGTRRNVCALRAIVRLRGTECMDVCIFDSPDCACYHSLSPGLFKEFTGPGVDLFLFTTKVQRLTKKRSLHSVFPTLSS